MPKIPVDSIITDQAYDKLSIEHEAVQRVLRSIQDFNEHEYDINIHKDTLKIIDGRKRLLVYKHLSKKTIGCTYKTYPENQILIRSIIPNLFREHLTYWEILEQIIIYQQELIKIKGEDHPMFHSTEELESETPTQLGIMATGLAKAAYYKRKKVFDNAIPEVRKYLIDNDMPMETANAITSFSEKDQEKFMEMLEDSESATQFQNAKYPGGVIYRYIHKNEIEKEKAEKKQELDEKFQEKKDEPHKWSVARTTSLDYASKFIRQQPEFVTDDLAYIPMMVGRRKGKIILLRFTDPESPFSESERSMLYDLFNIIGDDKRITIAAIEPHPYDSKMTKGAIVHSASSKMDLGRKDLIALCEGKSKKGAFGID